MYNCGSSIAVVNVRESLQSCAKPLWPHLSVSMIVRSLANEQSINYYNFSLSAKVTEEMAWLDSVQAKLDEGPRCSIDAEEISEEQDVSLSNTLQTWISHYCLALQIPCKSNVCSTVNWILQWK